MKFSTVFLLVSAIIFAVMVFSPEADAKRIPRRKLQALKRIGLVAILLKGKKKILFPLPLPLPLPLPVIQKQVLAEPEPIAIPEPVAYAEPSYAAPPSYDAPLEYGGGNEYGAAPAYPAPAAPAYGGAAPAYPAEGGY